MRKEAHPRRLSIRHAWLSALSVLIIGMILAHLIADMAVQHSVSLSAAKEEILAYRESIKSRIRDETETALMIAEFLYRTETGKHTREEIRDHIVGILESLENADVGYFFGSDYSGLSMLGPSKGTNVLSIQDKNGLYVVQELIKTAKAGGGFVEYVMPPIDGYEQAPKISYVLPFEPFGWYIGTGVTLSKIHDIEKHIDAEKWRRFTSLSLLNGLTAVFLIVALIAINRFLYRQVQGEIDELGEYLARAANEDCALDGEKFRISELASIARQTNRLVHALFSSMKTEAEAQRRFETVVHALPDLVFIVDREGHFLACEASDDSLLLVPRDKAMGHTIEELIPGEIGVGAMQKLREAFTSGNQTLYEYVLYPNGVKRWYEARFIPIDLSQILILVRDTTEVTEIRRKNEYLSYHDQLTNLYNRRYFEEEMNRLDSPRNLPLTLVMIDVNGLKMINDAFGHARGDELLVSVSEMLRMVCRSGEIIARTGGDEFVILLPETSKAEADRLIRRIYERLSSEPREEWIVSISIGFATKETMDETIESVYALAEKNMYRRKLAESQSMRNQTVQVIMRTLSEKNKREKVHSERVSALCRKIGEAMGLDYQAVKELETAGLLHDIGKIVIDEKLLNKEGPLTAEEFAEVKKHPEISYQILRAVDTYATIAEDILSHHERWDGKGYPRGVPGPQLSLTARIIAVADAYEAMTANRSYRVAISHEKAIAEILKNAGTQFDPEIAAIFAALAPD